MAGQAASGSDIAGRADQRPKAARGLWRAVSAGTSLALIVGAIVYGVALGSNGPLSSPVTIAAAPAAIVTADAPPPTDGKRGQDARGHRHGR